MRYLLTTQSQGCYREQVQKEMLTRLAWRSRYSNLYPSCSLPQHRGSERPQPPADPRPVLPPPARTEERQSHLPPPPHPPALSEEGDEKLKDTNIMRPASPQTRQTLYQDSSHHGRGRSLYLQRRGRIRPEERFEFPVLSSWEYGWRLGDYSLDYRTPSCARSPVVKNAFYARNGVFNSPSATDTLG